MQTVLLGFLTKGLTGGSNANAEKIIEGDTKSNSNEVLMYVGFGVIVLAIIGVIVYIGSKQKQS